MISRLRTSKAMATVALVSASAAVAFAGPQGARKSAAKDTGSVVVGSVNGEKVTRGELFDWVLADEAARTTATVPQIVEQAKQARQASGIIGAVVLKKLQANPAGPVSVTRQEILDFAFKDNAPVLSMTLDRYFLWPMAVAQEAKKQGCSATPAQVKAQTTRLLEGAKQMPGMGNAKTNDQILKAVGVRPVFLQRVSTMNANLENLVRADLRKKNGHDLGPDDFRAASHILIRVNPTPTPVANPDDKTPKPAEDPEKPWNEAKKKIEGIAADIKAGKITFEDAAKQYSDDGSKFQGGSLGSFPRGQMVEPFEKAAFSQEKGKIGEPVRTQFGWHLIRVDKLGSELTGKEREELVQRTIQGRVQAKLQDILGKAKIENKIKPATPPAPMFPGGAPRPGGR